MAIFLNLSALSAMSLLINTAIGNVLSNCKSIILVMEIKGRAKTTPPTPQMEPKKTRDKMATRGFIFTLSPTTFGVSKFPSTVCTTA